MSKLVKAEGSVDMLNLVDVGGVPCMSSRSIAQVFGKEIEHVHEKIKIRYPEMIEKSIIFQNRVRLDTRGYAVEYFLDEYQSIGLVLGFTGKKAREFQDIVVKVFVDYRNGRLNGNLAKEFAELKEEVKNLNKRLTSRHCHIK
jgi:phage regulator Rha-like protein